MAGGTVDDRAHLHGASDAQALLALSAHDLCNHLQVVASALSIIRRTAGPAPSASLELVLGGAQSSLQRAGRLCREMVDAGGAIRHVSVRISVAERLAALRETVLLAAGPDVQVELSAAEDVPDVYCCGESFDHAILNIVVNAARAMPGGGRISIAATCETGMSDTLPSTLPGTLPGTLPSTVLRIADTGCGMSPEVAARAFEPRFTTRAAGSGSGVGLAMVAEFARSAGGSVDLASRLDVGTIVTIRLPGVLKSARRSRPTD